MNGTLKTLGDIEAMVKSVRHDYSNAIIENEQYKKINKNLKAENKQLRQDINLLNLHQYAPEKIGDLYRQLKAENKILKDALEQCLYYTAMRDPDINTHKQACDSVESISKEALEKIR